jgi:primosomal protein N' (replication factor Y) (superfamily II helicase)
LSIEGNTSKAFCQVALNTPLGDGVLTYKTNPEFSNLKEGSFVEVPLGKRKETGCILEYMNNPPDSAKNFEIKEFQKPICSEIELTPNQIKFYKWIAGYYHYPLGQLIFDTLPKSLKRPRELSVLRGKARPLEFELNERQKIIFESINRGGLDKFGQYMVHGVTGSGKSVIYLELMKQVLSQGKSVLFLLPEINLTPQFVSLFEEHLDCGIYSYNSSISNSDKFGLWKLCLESDKPKLIIGVRSSVFLPVENLGLVIVDEEHDNSFKQEDRCPYNARDLAIKKAQLANVPVILGSATPTMESWHRFHATENYYELRERAGKGELPEVELIDCRGTVSFTDDYWPFHQNSIDKIKEALAKKEQVLVFVNKLGFANFIQCHNCGHSFDCPNCHTSLRVFKARKTLSCHICDYKDNLPEICPECGNMNLLSKGFGTERLKEVLEMAFPDKRIGRFDRDEIGTMKQLEERLEEFHRGDIDVLVGTQMLSKGHNFKRVNLVLILGVDNQLNYPDHRANERVYHLLTQVSGRSGRFGDKSSVLIQTLAPENDVFRFVKNHSFDEFYKSEIEIRKICNVSPFEKMMMIYLTSKFQDKIREESNRYANAIRSLIDKNFNQVEILGPRPAVVEKKVNKYTWSIMIKSPDVNQLHNLISTLQTNTKLHYSVSIKFDVDPYHVH